MSMLDDLKLIHNRDKSDALGIAQKQYQQLLHEFDVDMSGVDFSRVQHVVYAGMGGSALAASLFVTWPKKAMPFEIVREYDVPPHIGESTLFIAASYSGNTEETLSALVQAEAAGCQVAVIASGGALAEKAEQAGYPLFALPTGLQPRMATLYGYNALVTMFDGTPVVGNAAILDEFRSIADGLKAAAERLRPDVPTADNQAKQLALELMGNSVVVYAGPKLYPAAYKWKISFNENAKTVAWCNQYPEFNHNEFLGWTSHPTDKPYKVVNLLADAEHERVLKRFELSERLLSGRKPAAEEVEAQGSTLLEQLLWTVQLGDFVSLYLALLNGLDPTPVDMIEKLKAELAQ